MKLRGRVIKGLGLGTKLGYPTANLDIDWSKLSFVQTKLSFRRWQGVYAGRVTADGTTHDAAVVIGAREEHSQPLVEVHLLDFHHQDLYGKMFTVEVLKKISKIQTLTNPADLKKKIEQDIKKIKRWFNKSVLY